MHRSLTLAALLFGGAAHAAEIRPDAVLLRYPDVSREHVVFSYAGDLWLVEKQGGEARRLTSAAGSESLARFSPDGARVAFIGGYDGGTDLYVLELGAGAPRRITHHPVSEMLCDWTPEAGGDDALLYWSSEVSGLARAPRILRVPAAGGQPTPLPVPYGTFGSLDATGTWLAYTPSSTEFRTWKRYQGGMAQDVWLFNLKTHASRRVTDHPGTDALPMWHGREVVFLSDRGAHDRLNLYAFDLDSGATRQLTDHQETDVKFPSMGPEDVVYEADGKLQRYEFASGASHPIEVTIPGERPALRAVTLDVKENLAGASVGPRGVRVAVEARGEIFNVPVEEGVTRNLTRTDGVAERSPAWSPDGKWIAYFSDRSGEYELTLRRADGAAFEGADENGEQRLTTLGPGWKYQPTWSPDSRQLCFATNDGGLWLYGLETRALERIHTNPEGDPLSVSWSNDSGWLAWSHRHSRSRLSAIQLYDVAARAVHEVTSGMFDDGGPVFDREGDWLFFHSARDFEPIYEDLGTTWVYANTRKLLGVPLRADVENPLAPEDEQEEVDGEGDQQDDDGADEDEKEDADEGEDDGDGEKDDGKQDGDEDDDAADDKNADDEDANADEDPEPVEPLVIELAGFEARAVLLPVPAGALGELAAGKERLFYLRQPRAGSEDEKSALCSFAFEDVDEDAEEGEGDGETTVLEGGVDGYELTAEGDEALVLREGELALIELEKDQEFEALDLAGLTTRVQPRAEWRQLLDDVHRIYRDFFYEPGLHGVDWDGLHARYVAALEDATSRADVHFFIGEMISELNVGHAYNSAPTGGLPSAPPARPVGLLGCDWSLEQGAYRIARILGSDGPYDADARAPLAVHGVDAHVGDWLLAVNGTSVDAAQDVYAAFEGTAERVTELTLCGAPQADGSERTVLVEPLESETELRYRDWVAKNRRHVLEKSEGRIGYIHVPNTSVDGQNELVRQFFGQMHAEALIVDERWNSGGQIPTRFIELLNRPITNYWAIRHGEDWVWPPEGQRGPKAMLINGWAGSGGDAFPYYFRQAGLGKLIGRRTWGGLVGISGNPELIDGAAPTVPRFAFYELDGTWGVEGYGVAPDIEVLDDPALMTAGEDPQLEAAIAHLTAELATWQRQEARRPASPDRHASGVPEVDR